jgi:hypothetical protein
MRKTIGQFIAIAPIQGTKIESTLRGGLATVNQRSEVVTCPLLMGITINGETFEEKKASAILPGESFASAWNRKIFEFVDGTKFVMCPVAVVMGFEVRT